MQLRNLVLLPGVVITLGVGRPALGAELVWAARANDEILVVDRNLFPELNASFPLPAIVVRRPASRAQRTESLFQTALVPVGTDGAVLGSNLEFRGAHIAIGPPRLLLPKGSNARTPLGLETVTREVELGNPQAYRLAGWDCGAGDLLAVVRFADPYGYGSHETAYMDPRTGEQLTRTPYATSSVSFDENDGMVGVEQIWDHENPDLLMSRVMSRNNRGKLLAATEWRGDRNWDWVARGPGHTIVGTVWVNDAPCLYCADQALEEETVLRLEDNPAGKPVTVSGGRVLVVDLKGKTTLYDVNRDCEIRLRGVLDTPESYHSDATLSPDGENVAVCMSSKDPKAETRNRIALLDSALEVIEEIPTDRGYPLMFLDTFLVVGLPTKSDLGRFSTVDNIYLYRLNPH